MVLFDMPPYVLQVEGVHHAYKNDWALQGVSFKVEPGQIVCLLGPSGCGKTTLLRIVAGLIAPTSGQILIQGVNQQNIPTHRRNIGFVFQDAALFPHLNVYQNVAFPFTRGRRLLSGGDDWSKEVNRILHITNLQTTEHRSIATLSGGQLQRVALARALVYRPPLLLLDEPLSSLDNILKSQLLDLLLKLHDEYETSFLYVTHDEREALRIGTHIAIIDDEHQLRQFGTVEEVITRPASRKVASIVGGWNLIRAKVVGGGTALEIAGGLTLNDLNVSVINDSTVEIGIPTRALSLVPIATSIIDGEIVVPVTITRSLPWYDGWMHECVIKGTGNSTNQVLTCHGSSTVPFSPGAPAQVKFRKEDVHVFELR